MKLIDLQGVFALVKTEHSTFNVKFHAQRIQQQTTVTIKVTVTQVYVLATPNSVFLCPPALEDHEFIKSVSDLIGNFLISKERERINHGHL